MKRLIISFFSFTTISLSQPDTLWTKTFSLGHSLEDLFNRSQMVDISLQVRHIITGMIIVMFG